MFRRSMNFTFKIKLYTLTTCVLLLFFCSTYFLVQNSIEVTKTDLTYKLDSIENNLTAILIKRANALESLSLSLSPLLSSSNHKHIHELLLIHKIKPSRTIISSIGIMLLNPTGKVIADTISISDSHTKLKVTDYPQCLSQTIQKPFHLSIGNIREDPYVNEPIIPLTMKITDKNHNLVGVLCTGYTARELTEKLSIRYGLNKYTDHVTITNTPSNNINNNDFMLSTHDLIINFFQDQRITISRTLKHYPFVIKLELKNRYLQHFIYKFIKLFIWHSFLYLILFLISCHTVKNHIRNYLQPLSNKLHILKELSTDLTIASSALPNNKISLNQFFKEIDDLINDYWILKTITTENLNLKVKQKIMDLVLIEQHFFPLTKNTDTEEDSIYINKLLSLTNEESTTISLTTFLEQVSAYCCEFYHEFNIKISVPEESQKKFTFKHAALTETIFHIFTFIIRGNFHTDNSDLLLKGEFIEGNDFPLITIESEISNNHVTALGWASGPSYVYTSLLSIYLLAKDNKLFFNIIKRGNTIVFTLEPIDKKLNFYNQAFEE